MTAIWVAIGALLLLDALIVRWLLKVTQFVLLLDDAISILAETIEKEAKR